MEEATKSSTYLTRRVRGKKEAGYGSNTTRSGHVKSNRLECTERERRGRGEDIDFSMLFFARYVLFDKEKKEKGRRFPRRFEIRRNLAGNDEGNRERMPLSASPVTRFLRGWKKKGRNCLNHSGAF